MIYDVASRGQNYSAEKDIQIYQETQHLPDWLADTRFSSSTVRTFIKLNNTLSKGNLYLKITLFLLLL